MGKVKIGVKTTKKSYACYTKKIEKEEAIDSLNAQIGETDTYDDAEELISPEEWILKQHDAYLWNDYCIFLLKADLLVTCMKLLMFQKKKMASQYYSQVLKRKEESSKLQFDDQIIRIVLHKHQAINYYTEIQKYKIDEEIGLKTPHYYRQDPEKFAEDYAEAKEDIRVFGAKLEELKEEYGAIIRAGQEYQILIDHLQVVFDENIASQTCVNT